MNPDIENLLGLKEISPEESLIEYPCDFPIKVMAISQDELVPALCEIVCQYDPDFNHETVEVRPSSKGNYTGLTFTIKASSREQLDAVYHALHAHEWVKVVL